MTSQGGMSIEDAAAAAVDSPTNDYFASLTEFNCHYLLTMNDWASFVPISSSINPHLSTVQALKSLARPVKREQGLSLVFLVLLG